jgi:hypothetical protein
MRRGGVLIGVSSSIASGEAANHGGPASGRLPKSCSRRRHEVDAFTAPDMHKLSRTSLAAVVCPSAPFLVPRLLRATVPVALKKTPCSSLQKAGYATKPGDRKSERSEKKPDRSERKLKLTFRPDTRNKDRLSAVEHEVRVKQLADERC